MTGQGIYLSLAREDAKRLFALKEAPAIGEFLRELRASPRYREDGLVLEVGRAWDPIHRSLTDGTLDPDGGEFPNNECVLGGKRLCDTGELLVKVVRPDVVLLIAESLATVRREELRQRYFELDRAGDGAAPSDEEFTEVWIAFKQIRDLYAVAAEERSAVVFALQPES